MQPEAAVSFSSGGFSEIYDQPAYQSAAVNSFLQKNGDQWKGLFNPAGRGFPDVAAQGVRFHVFDGSRDSLISGTSASSPALAGVVSLLNNARLKAGQPPLGFLNPWLYSTAVSGFTEYVPVRGGSRAHASVFFVAEGHHQADHFISAALRTGGRRAARAEQAGARPARTCPTPAGMPSPAGTPSRAWARPCSTSCCSSPRPARSGLISKPETTANNENVSCPACKCWTKHGERARRRMELLELSVSCSVRSISHNMYYHKQNP